MARSFYTDTVTRLRAPLRESAHGDSVRDWAGATETQLADVRVQSMTSSEGTDLTVTTHRLLGPLALDIAESDRVRWVDPRGVELVFEVDGQPQFNRGPLGGVAHTVATLKAAM